MLGALIGQFANTSTLFFFLTWFPDYLVKQKHFTLLTAGFLAVIPYLCALVGTLVGGAGSDWLLRRGVATSIARKAPIITGLILSMIIIVDNWVNQPALIVLCFSIAFFAQGMASATAWTLLSDIAPANQIALTGGLFNFFANAGGALAPLVISLILSADRILLLRPDLHRGPRRDRGAVVHLPGRPRRAHRHIMTSSLRVLAFREQSAMQRS